MTTMTAPRSVDLLVGLDRLGVRVALKGDQISLQPASRVPSDLLESVRDRKADLATLLANPRRRWREQAEALVADCSEDAREDLLHLYDEREAIASVDGGLDDDRAGGLAYGELVDQVTLKEQVVKGQL